MSGQAAGLLTRILHDRAAFEATVVALGALLLGAVVGLVRRRRESRWVSRKELELRDLSRTLRDVSESLSEADWVSTPTPVSEAPRAEVSELLTAGAAPDGPALEREAPTSGITVPISLQGHRDLATRRLDADEYRYLWLSATPVHLMRGTRADDASLAIASAVNGRGRREIIGFDVLGRSSRAEWTRFLRSLLARGLSGVQLVIADEHAGLRAALAAALPGTPWQQCRTHFASRLLAGLPKDARPSVIPILRSLFEPRSIASVESQHGLVVLEMLGWGFDAAADELDRAREELLAFRRFPVEHWPRIWSNAAQERLGREAVHRGTDRGAVLRSVSEFLAETHLGWSGGRRYVPATPAAVDVTDDELAAETAGITLRLAVAG